MTRPLISIVLCTYNGEKYLREQVDSILGQQYENFEIVISDDASTDATLSILEEYRHNPLIKIFLQKENKGLSKNFEFAIGKTAGDYIAFSDQDDIWFPQKLEVLYNNIGDSFLVYSDSELVNEKGEPLNKKLSDLRHMYTGNETIGFVFANVVWGHAMMINRRLLQHAIPIPGKIPHDIWMGFRAATLTGIRYIDKTLTYYRQHSHTHTVTLPSKMVSRTMQKRYLDFIEKLNWIGVMRDYERPGKKVFYNRLYELYEQKSKGKYTWPLFFFMARHRRSLFMFRRKKWISQMIEIFKQARGEKHPGNDQN